MSVKQYFTQLFILHIACTSGACIFLVVGFFLGPIPPETEIPQLIKLFQVGLLGMMLVCGGMLSFLFPRTRFRIEQKKTLLEKLTAYRTWVIIRAALLEAVVIFSGVGVLLTGKKMMLVIGLGFLGFLVYFIPRKEKVIQEIAFTPADIQVLKEDDALIT